MMKVTWLLTALLLLAPAARAQQLVELPAPSWTGQASAAGGGRWALVVVADAHADATLDLALGARARQRLVAALGPGLDLAADRIRLLAGADVTEEAIERELRRMGAAVRGDDNLLLFHYVGRGWASRTGGLSLFTHATTRDGDGFKGTVAYGKIGALLSDQRQAAAERGVAMRVVSIVDACAPAGRQAPAWRHAPNLLDVELFAAAEGTLGAEGLFLDALCKALAEKPGEELLVGDLVDRAARPLKERGQTPELAGGKRDLLLRRKGGLGLALEAWDPSPPGRRPKGALVTLGDRQAAAPAPFSDLRAGRHAWQVSAPGHHWRTGEVALTRERSGQTLRVPLLPRMVVVAGSVAAPDGVAVAVRLVRRQGEWPEAQPLHLLEQTVTGAGPFALRAPPLDAEVDVVAEVDGAEVARAPLGLAAADHVQVADVRLPRRTVGRLTVPKGPRLEAVAPVEAGPLEAPALELADDRARASYEQLVKQPMAKGGAAELRQALAATLALADKVAPASRAAHAELRARLTLELARARRGADPGPARDELAAALGDPGFGGRSAGAARDQVVRWLVEDGRAALARGELTPGLALLDRAKAMVPERSDLAAAVRLTRERGWLRHAAQAVLRALQDDGWDAATAALAAASRAVGDEPLAPLRAVVERERMPQAIRAKLARADKAYADGWLEEAERLYDEVRPACTPFHASAVAEQKADLAARLLQRFLARAEELVAAGDHRGAAAALRRAERYDPEQVAELLEALPVEARGATVPKEAQLEAMVKDFYAARGEWAGTFRIEAIRRLRVDRPQPDVLEVHVEYDYEPVPGNAAGRSDPGVDARVFTLRLVEGKFEVEAMGPYQSARF